MRLISEVPEMSSRQVADTVGISNGSAYYVLSALVKKGLVKLEIFKKIKKGVVILISLRPKVFVKSLY